MQPPDEYNTMIDVYGVPVNRSPNTYDSRYHYSTMKCEENVLRNAQELEEPESKVFPTVIDYTVAELDQSINPQILAKLNSAMYVYSDNTIFLFDD